MNTCIRSTPTRPPRCIHQAWDITSLHSEVVKMHVPSLTFDQAGATLGSTFTCCRRFVYICAKPAVSNREFLTQMRFNLSTLPPQQQTSHTTLFHPPTIPSLPSILDVLSTASIFHPIDITQQQSVEQPAQSNLTSPFSSTLHPPRCLPSSGSATAAMNPSTASPAATSTAKPSAPPAFNTSSTKPYNSSATIHPAGTTFSTLKIFATSSPKTSSKPTGRRRSNTTLRRPTAFIALTTSAKQTALERRSAAISSTGGAVAGLIPEKYTSSIARSARRCRVWDAEAAVLLKIATSVLEEPRWKRCRRKRLWGWCEASTGRSARLRVLVVASSWLRRAITSCARSELSFPLLNRVFC